MKRPKKLHGPMDVPAGAHWAPSTKIYPPDIELLSDLLRQAGYTVDGELSRLPGLMLDEGYRFVTRKLGLLGGPMIEQPKWITGDGRRDDRGLEKIAPSLNRQHPGFSRKQITDALRRFEAAAAKELVEGRLLLETKKQERIALEIDRANIRDIERSKRNAEHIATKVANDTEKMRRCLKIAMKYLVDDPAAVGVVEVIRSIEPGFLSDRFIFIGKPPDGLVVG